MPPAAKTYCAVEVGLLDLCAKARGVPLSEMLGGRVRGSIRLYGSAGMYMPPEGYAAEAAAIAELGFRATRCVRRAVPKRIWRPCAKCAAPSARTST
jgi:L-alanine-DL-glutamate epimerase-like enolase superfamily enzyme